MVTSAGRYIVSPLAYSDRLRDALLVLSRDRLSEVAARLRVEVADRRSANSHAEAIARAQGLTTGDILAEAKRSELKGICEKLGVDSSGKEKGPILARIASALGEKTEALTLTSPEPEPAKPPRERKQRSTSSNGNGVSDYRHPEATRKNNPPAGLIEFDRPPPQPTKKYAYDPHLDPQLQWAGKAEHTSFEVDTVSLHIHEQVSAQAILKAVKREDAQRDLFAEPQLSESKQIDFYSHEVGWRNRLVLGDSLLVMNSLLEREQMAGKVQCIYVDPPYGVKFNSNFQPSISKREVRDGDDGSLTREPEQIQAYRDTWTLGVHTYLTYLRDRLLLARELLAESGSIFVQISDENVHHVRELLDEVFGKDNAVSVIPFVKTAGLGASGLVTVCDYLLWYSRDKAKLKYRQLFAPKGEDDPASIQYFWLELPDGTRRKMTGPERSDARLVPAGARFFALDNLTSGAFRENTTIPYVYENKTYHPGADKCWKTTKEGLNRLASTRRLAVSGNTLRYVRFLDDFPVQPFKALWTDTGTGGFGDEKFYVVQTTQKVIARCVLMTTDPGDLVLDPTCGSGTTACVAEQWGRRWITIDTSRVALSIARQRLLTNRYPYYSLRSEKVRDGFVYERVPHITLGSIANNARLDTCKTQEERERVIRESAEQEVLYGQPEENQNKIRVTGPFTVEAIPIASMEDPTDQPPADGAAGAEAVTANRGEGAPASHIETMLDLIRKTGVSFPGGTTLSLKDAHFVQGGKEWLHAEATTGIEGDPRMVAISFGPRHAPVLPMQVLQGIQETRGYDIVLFVGFALDPEAGKIINNGAQGRMLHFVAAASDILVGDLLKTTKATKLFTVFGLPDVKVTKLKGGEVQVELKGIDIYDPNDGSTTSDDGESAAAWFLDQDYDGKTFCICQAFFPAGKAKNPWEKLQRALKGKIDEEKFEALRGTVSLPFKPGKKLAVKVVDDRGNEVVKVVEGKA